MKKFIVISLFLLFFAFGFFSGVKQFFPYKEIKFLYSFFQKNIPDDNIISKIDSFQECKIPIIKKIPKDSVAIIGHAYGDKAKSNMNDSMAENVENFLINNSKNLTKVIFTGDVFQVPSLKKWQNLYNNFNTKFQIHISPGNHDVGRPDSDDVFKMSKFGKINYPYFLKYSDKNLIIENSVENNWSVSPDTIKLLSNLKYKNVVLRHHIPIKELSSLANQAAHEKLETFNELINKIDNQKSVTWIIGDSGGRKYLPRLICLKKNNHKFILNGIGEIKGDQIIILSGNYLYSFILDYAIN